MAETRAERRLRLQRKFGAGSPAQNRAFGTPLSQSQQFQGSAFSPQVQPSVFDPANITNISQAGLSPLAFNDLNGLDLNTGFSTSGSLPQNTGVDLSGLDLSTGFSTNGGQQGQGLANSVNTQDILGGVTSGIDIASGLAGLVGSIQQSRRAREAIDIARGNLDLNRQAAQQFQDFRSGTRSAFQ